MEQRNLLKTIELPIIHKKDGRWILLNVICNAEILRSDRIDGPYEIVDSDAHHVRQVNAKTSVEYTPKMWKT
ncbi:hypothetical protein J4219_05875 [Candidatus Woesearchaeota archaeon]|nr:hypothetical protein [Candidatus Woesearchaeota archaeon]